MGEDTRPNFSTEVNSGPISDTEQQSIDTVEQNPTLQAQTPHEISQQVLNNSYAMAQPQGPVPAAPVASFNMGAMAHALPQANYRQSPYNANPSQLRYNLGGPPAGIVSQTQHMPQYGGGMGHVPNQHFYGQQQQHMPPFYGAPMSPSQPHPTPNMAPRPNVPYYGNQQSHSPMPYYYAQMPQYHQQVQVPHQGMPGSFMGGAGMVSDPRLGPTHLGEGGDNTAFTSAQQDLRQSPDSQSNIVRGPPRKPRQSGHAIWIGNLPSQTNLMDLVHHVCKEAEGLESLFLISKSNCAFANYKDEASCTAAQQKLHESKFQTVRLVSRLRKNTVEGASGVTAPTGPAAIVSPPPASAEVKEIATIDSAEVKSSSSEADVSSATSPVAIKPTIVDAGEQKDKFFILKSLTLEDLDLSVRTGLWATQSHNEQTLNAAFEGADNVYLVFSANKSGEYYGYARMSSTISEDPEAKIQFAPKAQSVSDVDLPKEIPTEPTDTTPKGRIIDDSARGTIFWEIIRDDLPDGSQEQEEEVSATADPDDAGSGVDGGLESKTWGKPFQLTWLSTNRLPFYRCRGLRNPWNSNREVKIARDGTELEPSTGRRLIALFNSRTTHTSPIPRGPMMGAMGHMIPMGYPPQYS